MHIKKKFFFFFFGDLVNKLGIVGTAQERFLFNFNAHVCLYVCNNILFNTVLQDHSGCLKNKNIFYFNLATFSQVTSSDIFNF